MGVSRLWTWNENKRQSPFVKKTNRSFFFPSPKLSPRSISEIGSVQSVSFFFPVAVDRVSRFVPVTEFYRVFFFFTWRRPPAASTECELEHPAGRRGFTEFFCTRLKIVFVLFFIYFFFCRLVGTGKKTGPEWRWNSVQRPLENRFQKVTTEFLFFFTEFLSSHNRMCCDFDKNGQLCDFFSTSYHKFEFKEDVLTCSRLEIFPLRIWISIRWNFFFVCF